MTSMVASVAPKVIRRIHDLAVTNQGTQYQVYVGVDPTGDPLLSTLLVGVDDPLISQLGDDAAGQQSLATFRDASNHAGKDDEGTIYCTALAWIGDSGSTAALSVIDLAYGIKATVEGFIRADPTLGLQADGTCQYIVAQVTASRHRLLHDVNGTSCSVFFGIAYKARI